MTIGIRCGQYEAEHGAGHVNGFVQEMACLPGGIVDLCARENFGKLRDELDIADEEA